jgi:phospholipid/cholesterol/gamma-HCH transport system ATP-binding protein
MNNGVSLVIKNLSKKFDTKYVLDGVSLDCNPSDSICILGESGTGKSVLMRIIGTLLEATSGSVKIDNTEIVGLPRSKNDKVMNKIGFLFQYSGLFEHLTIWENVAFRELFVKKVKKKDAMEVAFYRLSQCGLQEKSFYLKPNMISGGMQRRVAMARTLMKEPKLILLDEPTSGLDPVMSDVINDLIIKTKGISKATVVTITHDLNSAVKISDKIFILRNGNFIWNGPSSDIDKSEIDYVKLFLKSANINIQK